MPVIVSKQPPVIRLSGRDIEPPDGSLDRVSAKDREDYWRQVAKEAFDAVVRQINSGKDIHGHRHRRKHKRRDGANGGFLSPHWSLSRVQTQVRYNQVGGREAVVYWRKPWSLVVGYWAVGVRGVVHDIVGLTAESLERLKARVWQWWAAKVNSGRLGQAGVTMLGGGTVGTVAYHREFGSVLPSRPATFAALAPTPKPAMERAPALRHRQPAFALVQAIQPIYEAAGTRRTTLAEIGRTVNRLGQTQSAATLAEVAWRLGVTPIPTTREDALRLIRATLEDRWRGGLAGGKPPTQRPPKPAPVPPRPLVVPVDPFRAAIEDARRLQRAANVAAARERPIVEQDVVTGEIRWRTEHSAEHRKQIADAEVEAERLRPDWEAVKKRRDEVVEKMWDWGLSKQTRKRWEKKLGELQPEYDRLRDAVDFAPLRIKAWREMLAENEARLATARAHPDARRIIPYAEMQARHPDLIPPGPIAERLDAYKIGDAKVKAILDRFQVNQQADIDLAMERTRLGKEIAAKLVEQADLLNPFVSELMVVSPEAQARADALQVEIDRLADAKQRIADQQRAASDRKREEIRRLFQVKDGVRFEAADVPEGYESRSGPLRPLSPETRKNTTEAELWLQSVVGRSDIDRIATKIGEEVGRRAHFSGGADHIQVDRGEDVSTIIHEYGHAIEARLRTGDDPVVKRSLEFLRYRVKDEKPVDLKEKFGRGDKGEMGAKDEFDKVYDEYRAHYVGKDYGRDDTEIVSMGLELLYNDPVRFANNDPEYCKFILGILDGSLR